MSPKSGERSGGGAIALGRTSSQARNAMHEMGKETRLRRDFSYPYGTTWDRVGFPYPTLIQIEFWAGQGKLPRPGCSTRIRMGSARGSS